MRLDNDDIRQEISLWAIHRRLPDPVNLPRSTRLRRRFAIAAAGRHRSHLGIDNLPANAMPISGSSPIQSAIATEQREVITGTVQSVLTGRHRDVALLLLRGLNVAEITEETGLAPRQIYNSIDYAKRKLRKEPRLRSLVN